MKIFLAACLTVCVLLATAQDEDPATTLAVAGELSEDYCVSLDIFDEDDETETTVEKRDTTADEYDLDEDDVCVSFDFFDELEPTDLEESEEEDTEEDTEEEIEEAILEEGLDRGTRGLGKFFRKLERNLRPVGKPILQNAAAGLMLKGLGTIGLGKRSLMEKAQSEVEKRDLDDFFKKLERNLRPVGKPILQAAAGNLMLKGLGAIGLGKRSLDQKSEVEKRGLDDFFKKLERNLRPVGKPILQAAAGNLMLKGLGAIGLGKRSLDQKSEVEKRGLDDFFKKLERNLRPVGKPILQAAAGNLMLKGLGAIGLGKRSLDQKGPVEKRGLGKFFKKLERNLRPVGKPILQNAAGNLMLKGLGAIGLGKK